MVFRARFTGRLSVTVLSHLLGPCVIDLEQNVRQFNGSERTHLNVAANINTQKPAMSANANLSYMQIDWGKKPSQY